MKLSSKISLAVFLVALVTLGLLAYPSFKQRYLTEEKTAKTEKNSDNFDDQLPNSNEDLSDLEGELIDESENGVEESQEDMFLEVLEADCKNECKNFQDPEDIAYCKNVCGLVETKKNVTGCDALEDLEKDYCLKDLAISKTDEKICDQIEDSGIKKTCKNRLIEDIIDKQMEL